MKETLLYAIGLPSISLNEWGRIISLMLVYENTISPKYSKVLGNIILLSFLQSLKAKDLIVLRELENIIFSRERQFAKARLPIISTLSGIIIFDIHEQPEKAWSQIIFVPSIM